MFCRHCGAPNASDSAACIVCRRSLAPTPEELAAAASRAAAEPAATPSDVYPGVQWGEVAGGLRRYHTIILITVIVSVLAAAIGFMMGRSGSVQGVMTLAVGAEIVGLILGVYGLLAIRRYSRALPDAETGQGFATATAVLITIGLLLSLIGLGFALAAIGGSFSTIAKMSRMEQGTNLIAGVLGVATFYTLMAALSRTARALSRSDIQRRIVTTRVVFLVTIGLAILASILLVGRSPGVGLFFAIGALIAGIFTLVYTLMVLSEIANAAAQHEREVTTFE